MNRKEKSEKVRTLSRGVTLDIAKNGVVTFRTKHTDMGDGLPFYSTETVEQAEHLIVLLCKCTYDNKTYMLSGFSGNAEDILGCVYDEFNAAYKDMIKLQVRHIRSFAKG